MPKVFKKTYTRPIPDGAERLDSKDQPLTGTVRRRGKDVEVTVVRFRGEDGRTVTVPVVERGEGAGTHCLVESPTWYGWVGGKAVPLCANRAASVQMLNAKLGDSAKKEAGLEDPFAAPQARPLAEHLGEYRRELESRDNVARYVGTVIFRLEGLFAGCGFSCPRDFDAGKASSWLKALRQGGEAGGRAPLPPAGQQTFTRNELAALLGVKPSAIPPAVRRRRLQATGQGKARRYPRATAEALLAAREGGASVATSNAYLTHLKSFCAWLVAGKKARDNPFAHLEGGNADGDKRHHRRELTAEELRHLLATTRASTRAFRGLTGEDRFHLYACACGTGFRAGGIAALTPACFDLASAAAVPTVTLSVRSDKSRKGKVQPLPADVADLMRAYLAGRPDGDRRRTTQPVWPAGWLHDAALMIQADLADAGIPYEAQGPDGTLFADFHALRHTYLTLAGKAGIDLRTVQELAGHSTPVLTARYSHRRLHDLAGAVEKMPAFLPLPAEKAADESSDPLQSACSPLAVGPDGGGVFERVGDGEGPRTNPPSARPNPLVVKGDEARRGPESVAELRAGDRIRTDDVQLGKLSGADARADADSTLRQGQAALAAGLQQLPPDLARLAADWAELPGHVRAAILMLTDAASATKKKP